MADRADVLVWDNLANDMMGVGALPAVEDALRRLVKPGGSVIPAGCAIKAALAEDRSLEHRRMRSVEGFDLSPFNLLAKPAYTVACGSDDLSVRSTTTTLFNFDFRSGGPNPALGTSNTVIGTGRDVANGVDFNGWNSGELDDEQRYDTAPGGTAKAFGLEFHPAEDAFEAERGENFMIGAAHDRERLRVWLKRN